MRRSATFLGMISAPRSRGRARSRRRPEPRRPRPTVPDDRDEVRGAPRGPDVRLGSRGAVVHRVHLARPDARHRTPRARPRRRERRARAEAARGPRGRGGEGRERPDGHRAGAGLRDVAVSCTWPTPTTLRTDPASASSRYRDDGASLSGRTVIIEGIPAARNHAGCRIRFGPDGKLYVTTGDATDRKIAQDLKSLGGKTLRLNPDGSIPADNPFPGSPVFSYGHRNAQGIDWDPRSRPAVPDGARAFGLRRAGRRRRGQPRGEGQELRLARRASPGVGRGNGLAAARVHARGRAVGSVVLDREGSALVPGRFLLRQPSRRGSHPRAVRSEEPRPSPRDGGDLSERSTGACATSSSAPTGRSTSPRATATAADSPVRATIAFFGLSKPFPCIRLAASQWNLRRWSDSSPSCGASRCARWAENRPTSAWSRARAWPATGSTTSSTRSRARC